MRKEIEREKISIAELRNANAKRQKDGLLDAWLHDVKKLEKKLTKNLTRNLTRDLTRDLTKRLTRDLSKNLTKNITRRLTTKLSRRLTMKFRKFLKNTSNDLISRPEELCVWVDQQN